MHQYGPWLHHIAHQMAPKTTPTPNETKLWKKEHKQRHQLAVKDIWGDHLRRVEHLITNANAPDMLLAITKDLYVDTMVEHGEGESSTGSSSSQAPSSPTESLEAVPIRGGTPVREEYPITRWDQQRRDRLKAWGSDRGLQEIEKVQQAIRQDLSTNTATYQCLVPHLRAIYQSITALCHEQRYAPDWERPRAGARWFMESFGNICQTHQKGGPKWIGMPC